MTERISEITGTAIPIRGDNIDTDRIIPARFLRSVTFEGLEQHLFEDDRRETDARAPGTHPVSNPSYRDASILVANANFGCGSSREHAPQAIRRRGIRAVVAESFSEIFFGNSVALGMPCVTVDQAGAEVLMTVVERDPSIRLTVDLEHLCVTLADRKIPIALPAAARESFLDGTWDATGLLLDRYQDVDRVAARLPYMHGFRS
jgi:3-isopropylmalate/(R)-2-methylmalate dehydratase small subunit